jgi:hypothetical protein
VSSDETKHPAPAQDAREVVERLTAERDDARTLLEANRRLMGKIEKEWDEARSERDALSAKCETLRANLAWTSKTLDESRGLGYLTRAEKAEKERDALKADLAKLRADLVDAHADLTALTPAPAPLDPRALAIYEGAVRYLAATAASGLNDGPEDAVKIMARTLGLAEQKAAK